MNSKKLVAMGLALILALSLCACAANEPAGMKALRAYTSALKLG